MPLSSAQWRKKIYLPSQVIKLFSRSRCFLFQGIYVSKIIAGGSAAATGKLRMGDRILAVNTTDIRNVTHQEAVMSLLQVNYFYFNIITPIRMHSIIHKIFLLNLKR